VWLDAAKGTTWNSLEDVRRTFPSTDMVGPLAIFNIKGTSYRLIVRMVYRVQKIYVKEFLTHAEYGKDRWKKWL
jgi:mRNA interferase HigB